jgi:hypothetical protein
MKSSFHSLIPFLPLFCSCQFRRIDSVPLLCSQAHILAGWSLETRLTLLNWTFICNHFARATRKTRPLYCWEGVFAASLYSNGSYSIAVCVFVAAGMCLPSRCLAMNMYSDFTIPAFGRHVTVFSKQVVLIPLFPSRSLSDVILSINLINVIFTEFQWLRCRCI